MIQTSIGIDTKEYNRLDKFFKMFPQVHFAITGQTAIQAKKLIVKDTPVKIGDARKSWRIVRWNDAAFVTSDRGRGSIYTPFLETGTGEFGPLQRRITGKRGRPLAFFIYNGNTQIKEFEGTNGKIYKASKRTGKFIFASVKGMKPRWMIKNNIPEINKALIKNANSIIEKLYKESQLPKPEANQ